MTRSTPLLVLLLASLGTTTCTALYDYPGADGEDTFARCVDGVDNDFDGRIDCDDPDCAAACEENDEQACRDSVDNDFDGRIDCQEFSCASWCMDVVELPLFAIDRTEVTRELYEAWLASGPDLSAQPPVCAWNHEFAPGCLADCLGDSCADHPQVCVDWCDAFAYCQAVGKHLCGRVGGGENGFADWAESHLSQWFNACSSGGKLLYPYAQYGYEAGTCNGSEYQQVATTVPVATLTGCQSGLSDYWGVYDLSGNAAEWEDACADHAGEGDACRTRGGGYLDGPVYLACNADGRSARNTTRVDLGFRCCSHCSEPGCACSDDSGCQSGHCVAESSSSESEPGAVCCDRACEGLCTACVATKTGHPSGTCEAVVGGTNWDGDCPGNQVCDGQGACVACAAEHASHLETHEGGKSCGGGLDCGGVSCCQHSLVKGGAFAMGRSESDCDAYDTTWPDEQPEHVAIVADFYLDTFEVTVGRYRAFVDSYEAWRGEGNPEFNAGAHPGIAGSGWQTVWDADLPPTEEALVDLLSCSDKPMHDTWSETGDNDSSAINCVSWFEAFAFCIWDGGRLPTEAEWEYAAAGGSENRLYPWGGALPGKELANYGGSGASPLVPVGSHPAGVGRWGQHNLAGNMWEWVMDAYDHTWYAGAGICDDCANLFGGFLRSYRSNGWYYKAHALRVADRNGAYAWGHNFAIGFRCARDRTP